MSLLLPTFGTKKNIKDVGEVNEDNYFKLDQVYLGFNAERHLLDWMSDTQFAENDAKVKSDQRILKRISNWNSKRFPFEVKCTSLRSL